MKKIIEESGMKLKEFSEYYEIPYNTIRQWYNETRKAPKYVIDLIQYKIKKETQGTQITIYQKTNKMNFNKQEMEIIDNFYEWINNYLENFEINEEKNQIINKKDKEIYEMQNALAFTDIIEMYYKEYYNKNKSFE